MGPTLPGDRPSLVRRPPPEPGVPRTPIRSTVQGRRSRKMALREERSVPHPAAASRKPRNHAEAVGRMTCAAANDPPRAPKRGLRRSLPGLQQALLDGEGPAVDGPLRPGAARVPVDAPRAAGVPGPPARVAGEDEARPISVHGVGQRLGRDRPQGVVAVGVGQAVEGEGQVEAVRRQSRGGRLPGEAAQPGPRRTGALPGPGPAQEPEMRQPRYRRSPPPSSGWAAT